MHLKKALPFIAVLALSACEQNTVAEARYECGNRKTLNATFINGKEVLIDLDGAQYKMARTEAASGAKYESDGSSFWSKGIDALFVARPGDAPLKCRRS